MSDNNILIGKDKAVIIPLSEYEQMLKQIKTLKQFASIKDSVYICSQRDALRNDYGTICYFNDSSFKEKFGSIMYGLVLDWLRDQYDEKMVKRAHDFGRGYKYYDVGLNEEQKKSLADKIVSWFKF